jgi:NADPH:quinone reductase-like Zn-dependent oxidoreductase
MEAKVCESDIKAGPLDATNPIQRRKGNAMKAFQVKEFGGPDCMKPVELPDPVPGPGEVLVRVRAVSLNYRDLLMSRGTYNPKMKLPMIPISDGAGEVAGIGAGVTRFKVGDQVVANFMPAWVDGPPDDQKARSALGGGAAGMLAELVVVPDQGLLTWPIHLSALEAATLPCAAVTAWNALVTSGGVKPGDTVLIQGTGGVSLFALQFARLAGAKVIVTSGSDHKLARALDMGAASGINYKTTPDWDKRARELTGGKGVDQIIEVGGAGTLPRSLRAIRTGGYVALIGVLSGVTAEVNPMPILMRNIRVQGIFVGSRAMFEAMNRALEINQVHPIIDRVFDFGDAPEALKYLESGAHFGKIVVRV